jgi:hypothetical protein
VIRLLLIAALALSACGEIRRAQRDLDTASSAARQARRALDPGGDDCRPVVDRSARSIALTGFELPLEVAPDGALRRVGRWTIEPPTTAPAAAALLALDQRQARLCEDMRARGGAVAAPDLRAQRQSAVEDLVQVIRAFRDASGAEDFARRTAGPVERSAQPAV